MRDREIDEIQAALEEIKFVVSAIVIRVCEISAAVDAIESAEAQLTDLQNWAQTQAEA